MGQNVKSPFSNIRARTSKLHLRSSRIGCQKSGPVTKPHSRLRHRLPAALPAQHLPTRFRALELFSRRSPQRVVRSSLPAAENLHTAHSTQHTSRQSALQQIAAYSITWSARPRSVIGTLMPSALAVFRLMPSRYLVGACTGRIAAFSPLRMRATSNPISGLEKFWSAVENDFCNKICQSGHRPRSFEQLVSLHRTENGCW
jgi:hypothetical protein